MSYFPAIFGKLLLSYVINVFLVNACQYVGLLTENENIIFYDNNFHTIFM